MARLFNKLAGVNRTNKTERKFYGKDCSPDQFGSRRSVGCFAPAAPLVEGVAGVPGQAGRRLSGYRQGLRYDDDQRSGLERRCGEEVRPGQQADLSAIRGVDQETTGRETRQGYPLQTQL